MVTGSGILHVEPLQGGKLVLGPIWRRNLKKLKKLVESN